MNSLVTYRLLRISCRHNKPARAPGVSKRNSLAVFSRDGAKCVETLVPAMCRDRLSCSPPISAISMPRRLHASASSVPAAGAGSLEAVMQALLRKLQAPAVEPEAVPPSPRTPRLSHPPPMRIWVFYKPAAHTLRPFRSNFLWGCLYVGGISPLKLRS